jgi:hypothetical protein
MKDKKLHWGRRAKDTFGNFNKEALIIFSMFIEKPATYEVLVINGTSKRSKSRLNVVCMHVSEKFFWGIKHT